MSRIIHRPILREVLGLKTAIPKNDCIPVSWTVR
jgi:hypothetical protein